MLQGALLVLAVLIGGAIVSVINGQMHSHADVVFLALLAWTAVVTLVRGKIINKIDRTNGNDTGIIAFFFYAIVAVLCIFAACVTTLLGGEALIASVAGVVVITAMAAWTAWWHA